MQKIDKESYEAVNGIDESFMAYKHPEVLPHWPPQLIIGKHLGEEEIQVEGNDLINIRFIEVKNEWMYSNPTGMFNLSLPSKPLGTNPNNNLTTTYAEHKQEMAAEGETLELVTRSW